MSVLAIIPAKGTSERIPGKNMRPFLGVPALQMTLEVLSKLNFSKTVVSTDDDHIGALAARMGAVYFKRSPETCLADAPMVDAVIEVLEDGDNWRFDHTLVVYPVAPFIDMRDIIKGLDLLRSGAFPVIYPIYRAHEIPERALIIQGNCVMPRYPEHTETNSQGFRQTYQSAGQWYACDTGWLMKNKTLTPNHAGFIEIPEERAIDIDTIAEWQQGEMLYLMNRLPGFYGKMIGAVRRMTDEFEIKESNGYEQDLTLEPRDERGNSQGESDE